MIHFAPRINLSASETVSRLSRHLSDRAGHINWAECLTQLVYIVIQAERIGKPAVSMAEIDEPVDTGYLVKNWILPALPTSLFGLGGTGKTWIGLTLLTAAFHGMPFLIYFPQRSLKVGMWDYENNEKLTRSRLGRVARGMGLSVPNVIYRRLELPLPEYEEVLARDIEQYELDLVLLDSFGLATGGSQNKDELVLATYTTLRRLGVSTFIIDHESKESANSKEGGYAIGSVYKHNSSRITWHVKATKESQETNDLFLRLTNTKANEDKRLGPFGIHMHFGEDFVRAQRIDLADLPDDLTQGMTLSLRIVLALQQQTKMSTAELADLLGEKHDTMRVRLNELERRHRIVRLEGDQGGRGHESTWGLRSDVE